MTMQRRHFEFIASVIREMADKASGEVAAHEFARACAMTNPDFDKSRFLKACGADPVNPGYGIK
jgi:hypothetical protein